MVLRGIAARGLVSLTILALTALVVAGTLVSVTYAGLTGVSRAAPVGLVLLGFVALAAQAVESMERRDAEIALARLRGRSGASLVAFAVAEPVLVVLAGAAAGVAIGWALGRVVVHAWIPGQPAVRIDGTDWLSVGAVTAGALLVVVLASRRGLREPLLGQLTAKHRPRRATAVVLFLQLLLVLAAIVSVYEAHQASRSRLDWLTLASPALVGLAAGQVLIWVVSATLAAVVARRRGSGVGWFLAVRRVVRRADSLSVVRLVVAAGVVLGVAASASVAAQSWRADRARLQIGAPVSYPVPDGALRAYAAAHLADPRGRWLLPVAAYTADSDGGSRRVFVDSPRWTPVVGDFLDSTAAVGLTDAVGELPGPSAVHVLRGATTSATVVSTSLPETRRLILNFQYVNDRGDTAIADLSLARGRGSVAGPGVTRFTGKLADCRVACSLIAIDVTGDTQRPGQLLPPLRLLDVTFGGGHVLTPQSGFRLSGRTYGFHVRRIGSQLAVVTSGYSPTDTWGLGRYQPPTTLPAVSTGGFSYQIDRGRAAVSGVDGSSVPVRVTARLDVLPFVGTRGSVLDLGTVLAGATGSIPETEARILARSNTPASVLAKLRATGSVGRPTTYAAALTALADTPRAQGTRLYVLVAVFAGLIAMVGMVSALAQQTRERRVEAASLRSVGVGARAVSGAYRREAVLLAAATVVGTALAAWVACRALLPALPLVSGWAFAPPLDATPPTGLVTVVAVAAGAVVGLLAYLAFRGIGRSAPPRILREDAS